MKLYEQLGSRIGTPEATALCARLSEWHDAMVAHERRRERGDRAACDDECPHVEAHVLWGEAVSVLGALAQELKFLRSRALGGTPPPAAVSQRAARAEAS